MAAKIQFYIKDFKSHLKLLKVKLECGVLFYEGYAL